MSSGFPRAIGCSILGLIWLDRDGTATRYEVYGRHEGSMFLVGQVLARGMPRFVLTARFGISVMYKMDSVQDTRYRNS